MISLRLALGWLTLLFRRAPRAWTAMRSGNGYRILVSDRIAVQRLTPKGGDVERFVQDEGADVHEVLRALGGRGGFEKVFD